MKSKTILLILGVTILIVIYGLFDPTRYTFPPCPMRTLTGWLCPGCGSQRAIHQALHGNFASSFQFNQLFLPAVIYGLIGVVSVNFFPSKWPVIRRKFYGLNAAYVSLAIILLFWVMRNLVT